jgi:hypothetical protein
MYSTGYAFSSSILLISRSRSRGLAPLRWGVVPDSYAPEIATLALLPGMAIATFRTLSAGGKSLVKAVRVSDGLS